MIDKDRFLAVLSAFEHGEDLPPGPFNPDEWRLDTLPLIEAFVSGQTVPDTLAHCAPLPEGALDHCISCCIAGFLQGCTIAAAYEATDA